MTTEKRKTVVCMDQTLLDEMEEISDLVGYMVGEGGLAGVVHHLKRMTDLQEMSREFKRTVLEDLGDLSESVAALTRSHRDAHGEEETRWFFVRSDLPRPNILQVVPTHEKSFGAGGECVTGWQLQELAVPRSVGDAEWWVVYAVDSSSVFASVGAFTSHNMALAVCQMAWRQVHAAGDDSPAWVRRSVGRTTAPPVRIPSPRAARTCTMVILPPSIMQDVEVYQLQ